MLGVLPTARHEAIVPGPPVPAPSVVRRAGGKRDAGRAVTRSSVDDGTNTLALLY
jgi:hypothetical protein